jgi:hypothetical protein
MECTEETAEYASQRAMPDYRVLRRGMLALPHLESNLAVELEYLTRLHQPLSDSPFEGKYLYNSLRTVRGEILHTHRALTGLRRAFKSLNLSDKELEKMTYGILKKSPHAQDIFLRIRTANGLNSLLDSISESLLTRKERYSECIKLAKEYMTSPDGCGPRREVSVSVAELALRVAECVPPSSDPIYAICAVPPLVCIIAAIVGFAVLVGCDGDEDDEDDELGDFPVPDPDADTPA